MPLKTEQYNQVCVLGIDGDLSHENAANLRREVEDKIEQLQIVEFIVDLEKCPFIDSEGIETLLWIRRRCDELFGQVRMINLDDNCRKILEITRLEHRIEMHDDLAGALKTMR